MFGSLGLTEIIVLIGGFFIAYIIYRIGGKFGCLTFIVLFFIALLLSIYVIENIGLKGIITLAPFLIGPYVGRRISKRRENRQESPVNG